MVRAASDLRCENCLHFFKCRQAAEAAAALGRRIVVFVMFYGATQAPRAALIY
jgi:hypothetical protein